MRSSEPEGQIAQISSLRPHFIGTCSSVCHGLLPQSRIRVFFPFSLYFALALAPSHPPSLNSVHHVSVCFLGSSPILLADRCWSVHRISIDLDPMTGLPRELGTSPFKLEDYPIDNSHRKLKVAMSESFCDLPTMDMVSLTSILQSELDSRELSLVSVLIRG